MFEILSFSKLLVGGFSESFRLERIGLEDQAMTYLREDIPSKLLTNLFFPNDIEGLFKELNFRKTKWLLIATYHPPS